MQSTVDKKIQEMRLAYNEKMNEYFSKQSFCGPWTREWLKELKTYIINKSVSDIAENDVYEKFLKHKSFKIDNTGDKLLRNILIKTFYLDLTTVPWEDAFHAIWKKHLESNHGSVDKTMKLLRSEIYVHLNCVNQVIELCDFCKEKKQNVNSVVEPIFNKVATLEILDLTDLSDGNYKYLIIYRDEGTGLYQLRALMEVSECDMKLKLMQIFCDLGTPQICKVQDPYGFDKIFEILNAIFYPCTIHLEFCMFESKTEYVKEMLLEWMAREGTTSWEIGCYGLQWELNNITTTGNTPQQLVFGSALSEDSTNQCYIDRDSQNCESQNSDTISVCSSNSQIILFEEPETVPQQTNPKEEMMEYVNYFDDEFVVQDEIIGKSGSVESSDMLERDSIEFKKSDSNKKAYVNKKVLALNQNDVTTIIEKVTDSLLASIKQKPKEESVKYMTVDNDQPKQNIGSHMKDGTNELNVLDNVYMCCICHKEILKNSYTCIKCTAKIHLDCGEIVQNDAEENTIVCFACEQSVKKIKLGL